MDIVTAKPFNSKRKFYLFHYTFCDTSQQAFRLAAHARHLQIGQAARVHVHAKKQA